jgi:glycosyltransferase involved in cell wall biosynthesis
MRILQVITTLRVGGGQRLVTSLAGRLRTSGHAVRVVSLFPPSGSALEAELTGAGVSVEFLGKRPGVDLRMVTRLARAIATFRPDVVHTHLGVLKYVVPATVFSPRPVVHTVHTLADREAERASRWIQYFAFRRRVVPVAIGESVADTIRTVYRLRSCRVIPNGVPVAEYVPRPGARQHVRAALSIPADAPTFLAVGRLDPVKDHASLLRAFASTRLRSIDAHLVVAGDGALRNDLEHLATTCGVADRIRFLGTRSDVPRLLAAADAFVLASRWEGNPLSVMEAMAAGRPVVATRVGCVPELVPASAGTLVAPGDVAALESALFQLASELPRARAQGAAAARIAEARFDLPVMTRAYEALYEELTGLAPAASRAEPAPRRAVR